MIGANWGVQWCVVGADRNWAYNPDCKAAGPNGTRSQFVEDRDLRTRARLARRRDPVLFLFCS